MNTNTTLTTINTSLELKSPVLASMRERILPLYEKGAEEITRYADKAAAVVDRYNKAVALELAALPVNEKGKLDASKFDGFKTPVEIAVNVYGYGTKFAYTLLDYGRKCLDPNTPKEFTKFTPSNAAAIAGAKEQDVRKALATGEISATSSQRELKDWTAKHRKTETKTGKTKVVTAFTVYRGAEMLKAPHGDVTEDEFKASFAEDFTLLFMDKYTLEPQDAPGKKVSVRRYVAVSPELKAEVFTLIPAYERPSDKPAHAQKAEEFENGMIQKYMDANGVSRDDAMAALQKLGLL